MTASVFPSATSGSTHETFPTANRGRLGRFSVIRARTADHTAVFHFLTSVFQGTSRDEFRASIDDPFSTPQDRLLIKRDARIVAHAHLTNRVMQFGQVHLPVAGLHDLGTLREFRGRGFGCRMLSAAEAQMASTGALLGLIWTRIPYFFRRGGWAFCGQRAFYRAGARDVVSGLIERGLHQKGRKRLNIRPWRRMELPALVRIYQQNLDGRFGPFQRTEAYWKWLLPRKAYDQICVALDGPDLLELEETRTPIVGYAVTRGERIVEMHAAPAHRTACVQLLARACRDAIERGRNTIRLDAEPNSRVENLFQTAGGKHVRREIDADQVLMVKLLNPVKLLRRLAPELLRRVEAADLPLPAELGFLVDGKQYRLVVTPHGAKASIGSAGQGCLRLNVADFTRLVLGHLDWEQAISDRRVATSTVATLDVARALFPRLPLWRPPLDDLAAHGGY